jgi:hypothetical protein
MGKTGLTYLLFSVVQILGSVGFGQTWKTILASDYHSPNSFVQQAAGFEQFNKQFFVNPYDNSIWFGFKSEVHGFDSFGNYIHFNNFNVPTFQQQSLFLDFAATPNYIVALDRYFGIHKFEDGNWSLASNLTEGIDISSDQDTIFVARSSAEFLKLSNGISTLGSISSLKRIRSKNGNLWGSSSTNSFVGLFQNGNFNFYSPDTCALLDWTNFEMKFSKMSETIYIAGALGISIAINGIFTDSITPANTIGMPSSSVFEIEVDSQNNIWAVFGSAYNQVTHVGYLNRSTGIWTKMYDATNSPINFDYRVSIELDSADNLYVVDTDLHVLEINTLPDWLGLHDNGKTNQFNLFPNPATTTFTLSGVSTTSFGEKATLKDLSGKIVLEFILNEPNQKVDVSQLRKGIYILQIGESTEKIIIE